MISVVRATPDDVPAWRALAAVAGEVVDLAWLVRLDEAIEAGHALGAVDVRGRLVGGLLLDPPRVAWMATRTGEAEEALVAHARLLVAPRDLEGP